MSWSLSVLCSREQGMLARQGNSICEARAAWSLHDQEPEVVQDGSTARRGGGGQCQDKTEEENQDC